jgi:hypothetical protein
MYVQCPDIFAARMESEIEGRRGGERERGGWRGKE